MIILDEEPPPSKSYSYSDVAGPTLRFPDRVAGRSSAISLSLPDYETSQALANNDLVYNTVVKHKVDTRFWRATLYALIIYIALSIIIGVPILVTTLKRREHRNLLPPPAPAWGDSAELSDLSGPLFLDNLLESTLICNPWMPAQNSTNYIVASSKFDATYNGDFSIRSNLTDDFDNIAGDFEIGMNPDKDVKDAVLSITMQASSANLSQSTNVCFSKIDKACDLVILVPDEIASSDWLRFNVSLLFPHSTDPYTVNKLATWLPMFSQVFGKMDKQLSFNTVTIEGSSSRFDAGYIQANNFLVRTSMEEIRGKFMVNQSLTLDTVEAPINADITLVNDWSREEPTYLTLDTGNGDINTQILLLAPQPPYNHHVTFLTSIKTFNGSLKVNVAHDNSTLPSEFRLRAQNSLGQSYVTLDPKYEGTFDLQTKLASTVVKLHDVGPLVDPLGQNRIRHYQYDYMSNSRIFGWVGWGERPDPTRRNHQGNVEVLSSHSLVSLQLNGAGVQLKNNGQS